MKIREATDSDGAALRALIAPIFAEYDNCLFVDDEFPELAAPASHYAAKGGRLFVAERDGRVVGSLAAALVQPGSGELFKVYASGETRGTGLSHQLYALGESLMRDRGAREMVLWTDTRFARGHAFYEKLGFERQPVVRYLADVSATWEFFYRKRLG
ncbi:GNAT family N-acetyltransferase [Phreatobacter aquaticus]|uniref:GNAT family N-acetyltransferase n=1 Tax=Phreatobacter aquaticus TaxID=2570229 RepID=A0A4D7QJ95_9HYPH|nr:GNAT family N-acetyltransferase [Phreatobacter aquaticus]QCK85973.1 GNAT family N-acetyltransferase [Phreatobacter aquaticus]